MMIVFGFISPTIMKYLRPLTSDMFTVCFAYYHFDETTFPPLGERKTPLGVRRDFFEKVSTMSHLYLCISISVKCER